MTMWIDSVAEEVALGLGDGGVVGAQIRPIDVVNGHVRALVEIRGMSFVFEGDRQMSKWIDVPLASKMYALVDVLGAVGIQGVIDGRSSWRDLARVLTTHIESISDALVEYGELRLAQLAEEAKVRRTSKSPVRTATMQQRIEFQQLKDEAARLKHEKAVSDKKSSSD